jgi:hypothetical protein
MSVSDWLAGGALRVSVIGVARAELSHRASDRANELSAKAVSASNRANELSEQALTWQRASDAERKRTNIDVYFEHEIYSGVEAGQRVSAPEYRLRLIVYNGGETTETVVDISVQGAQDVPMDGATSRGFPAFDLNHWIGGQDAELRPRKRVVAEFATSEVDFDLSAGFRGVVRLASTIMIESEVETLHEPLADFLRANSGRI